MRSVELRIRKLPDGNFLETIRDITEQKLEEETLRKNEELFRIAFDHAPTGMSIIAPDGVTYLAVNPLLCEMFGYTREAFLGKTIHHQDRPGTLPGQGRSGPDRTGIAQPLDQRPGRNA